MLGTVTDCARVGDEVFVRVKVQGADMPHIGNPFYLVPAKPTVCEFERGQKWKPRAPTDVRSITLQFRVPGQPPKWEATGGARRTTISETTLRTKWRRVS